MPHARYRWCTTSCVPMAKCPCQQRRSHHPKTVRDLDFTGAVRCLFCFCFSASRKECSPDGLSQDPSRLWAFLQLSRGASHVARTNLEVFTCFLSLTVSCMFLWTCLLPVPWAKAMVQNNYKKLAKTSFPTPLWKGGPSSLAPSLSSSTCPYWPLEVVRKEWQVGCEV